jgi:hypothetical protein
VNQVPRRGHIFLELFENLNAVWRFLLGTCELIRHFVCKEKSVIIMLQILDDTLQKIIAWAARRSGFA